MTYKVVFSIARKFGGFTSLHNNLVFLLFLDSPYNLPPSLISLDKRTSGWKTVQRCIWKAICDLRGVAYSWVHQGYYILALAFGQYNQYLTVFFGTRQVAFT